MNKIKLMMMAVLLAALSGYSQSLESITNITFEGMTLGAQPTGYSPLSGISPASTAETLQNFIKVVDSTVNTAGTGQGMQFSDDSSGPTRIDFELSQNFRTNFSAIRFDFSFSSLNTAAVSTNYIQVGVMKSGMTSSSSANRFADVRIYPNGQMRLYGGAAALGSVTPAPTNSRTKVSMFLNDSDGTVAYTDPAGGGGTLPANTSALWGDGVFLASGALGATPSTGSTNGLGRFGINSGSGMISINFVFDDIEVSEIGPPSGSGNLRLYLLGE